MIRPEIDRCVKDAVAVIHRDAVSSLVLRCLVRHELVERKVELPGLRSVSVG
jgi:hypothetical protein